MQTSDADLYPPVGGFTATKTYDNVSLYDDVQQRDVLFRIHAPSEKGPYPVVVFSHGSLCGVSQYDRLTAHWASRGYAVICPQHQDALEAGPPASPPDLKQLLSSRVRDLSFAVDKISELESCTPRSGLFATEKFVAAGHSFGALTALIKLGLELRTGEYLFEDDPHDARFSCGINMSGVGPLPPLTDNAFDHLHCPLLVTGGTLDEGNVGAGPVFPWEWRMSAFDLAPAGDKYSLVLTNGDHYLGGLIARDDRGGDADQEGLDILNAATSAFLDVHVKDSASAGEWLGKTDNWDRVNNRVRFAAK